MPCQNDPMRGNEKGAALVTALIFMLIIMAMGTIASDRVATNVRESGEMVREKQAFLLAEAGLNRAVDWFNTTYRQPNPLNPPNQGFNANSTISAPVIWDPPGPQSGAAPVALPGNHPNDTYADCEGTNHTGVVTSFTTTLGTQANPKLLNGGTYYVVANRMIIARTNCDVSGVGQELWEIQSTGTYQGETKTVTAFFRRTYSNLFDFAIFGRDGIKFDSNAETQSFNSNDGAFVVGNPGNWNPQCDNGQVCKAAIGTNGTTNGSINMSSNSIVNGNGIVGPGVQNVDPGAITRQSTAHIDGQKKAADAPKALPSEPAPPACIAVCDHDHAAALPLSPGSYGTIKMTSNAVLILTPGTYSMTRLILDDGHLVINQPNPNTPDPVTIVIRDVPSGLPGYGSIGEGSGIFISGNSTVNMGGKPSHLAVRVAKQTLETPDPYADPQDVQIFSTRFVGTIYAPDAKVKLDSNARVYGAVVGRRVWLNSNSWIIYDRSLGTGAGRSRGSVEVPYFFGKP